MEDIKFEKVPSGIFDRVKTNKQEFVERFIDELEELFPDTVKDGKVDFQALLERFGEYQDNDERYELTWVGKNKARQESFEDIVGRTLKYIEEDSKNPETTENLYIEGDNLEVLKLLRKSYYGKIKMIYIDPPYNTGNDFVYKDDFAMSIEEYEELNGYIEDDGERLVKNTADSGRYHSNWLNMMYPRLCVAKDLLTDDGVIFISIDDNEVHNMRKICDEIFGEDKFVAQFIIDRTAQGANSSNRFKIQHEYCLMYLKKYSYEINYDLDVEIDRKKYKYKDCKGYYAVTNSFDSINSPLVDNKNRGYTVYYKSIDDVIIKDEYDKKNNTFNDYDKELINQGYTPIRPSIRNNVQYPFNWSKERFIKDYKTELIFKENSKGKLSIYHKNRFDGKVKDVTIKQFDTRKRGNQIVNELLGSKIFTYPKSLDFIKWVLSKIKGENFIVLDFFSGSATTAHAVIDLNAEDGGNRKFIMVQLPEPTDEKSAAYKEGYENICEIGKERIRRAGDKILEDNKDKEGIENLDTGFKVFRVEDTNFKRISDTSLDADIRQFKYKNIKDSEDFNPHFTDLDVVYELMLRRQDIELTEEIKKLDSIGDRTYIVGDTMLVCLEENITEEIVEKIGDIDTDLSWIVLRDSAFDDNCELKINTTRKLRSIIKSSRNKDQKIYWI